MKCQLLCLVSHGMQGKPTRQQGRSAISRPLLSSNHVLQVIHRFRVGKVPYETPRAWLKRANICSYLSNWDHCRSNRPLAPDTVPMFVTGLVHLLTEWRRTIVITARHCDGLGRRPLNPSRTTGSWAFRV